MQSQSHPADESVRSPTQMSGSAPGKRWQVTCLCLLALCPIAISGFAAEVSSPVHGVMTLTIKGHGGSASTALSFLGLGLTRPVIYQGHLEAVEGSVVVDQHANWPDDQFNGPATSCYLEITSGPGAGLMTDIVDTSGGTKSLTLADDLSGVLTGGETFKIRKHWTPASLFGANNEAGLGSGTASTADEILLYDPEAGRYTTYYYKTAGLGGTGWRSTANISLDASSAILELSRGLVIRRKQAADLSLKVFGAVKTGDTHVGVHPGLNILGNVYPTETLTLANSSLYTGDPTTGLAPGLASTADKLLIYNGSSYETYYYKMGGLGGDGWRSTRNISADASATVIPAGAGLLIQRVNNREPFFWVVNQPF